MVYGRRYPNQSSQSAIKNAIKRGNSLIKKNIGVDKYGRLLRMSGVWFSGRNSLRKHTNKDTGQLSPRRKKLHDEILKRQFANKSTIDRNDPDVYIFGGLPSSGKTTALGNKIPEDIVRIDSDYYKAKLAKKSHTPLKNLNLAHANYLHNEADLIVERAINKSIREKRDVNYDATMKSYDKGKALIDRFKRAGYDVHYLGTQTYPSKAVMIASKRFIKKGRYVPLDYIGDNGNKISRNSWKARKLADTYRIWDTNNILKIKLIAKSRHNMRKNFRNP